MRLPAFAAALLFAAVASAQERPRGVAELTPSVESIRGLKFRRELRVREIGEEGMRARVRREIEDSWPAAAAERRSRAWHALGLLPPGFDLREARIAAITRWVAGSYTPESGELFVVLREPDDDARSAFGVPWEDLITVHELTHALVDQYEDLQTIPADGAGNDDLALALESLVEGEANFVMYEYALLQQGSSLRWKDTVAPFVGGEAADSESPAILRRGLLFPYREGLAFVQAALRGTEGWGAMDGGLYRRLPLSTEQILHPEKYSARTLDGPQLLKLPDLAPALGEEWELLDSNVLGEWGIQVLLGERVAPDFPQGKVARAAAGWDGDRWSVYARDNETSLAWITTWDSETDALEFLEAAESALRRTAGAAPEVASGIRSWAGGTSLERRGCDVLWTEDCGPEAEALRAAAWKGLGRSEMGPVSRRLPPRRKFLSEAASFRLENAPKNVVWRVEEVPGVTTITWKGMHGAATFEESAHEGTDADALEAALVREEEGLEKVKRRKLSLDAVAKPSGGTSGTEPGGAEVRVGVVILAGRGTRVVARLRCAKSDWKDALPAFERIVEGFRSR